MKLLVDLKVENKEENELKYEFMNKLVKDLKLRLFKHIDSVNQMKVEKALLNFDILWKKKTKPDHIDVIKVLTEIINSIRWYEEKDNRFMVQIQRDKNLTGTNTSLETIAKVIDYGTKGVLPIRFFASQFNFFAIETKAYWSSYKQIKTQIKVKSLITIC